MRVSRGVRGLAGGGVSVARWGVTRQRVREGKHVNEYILCATAPPLYSQQKVAYPSMGRFLFSWVGASATFRVHYTSTRRRNRVAAPPLYPQQMVSPSLGCFRLSGGGVSVITTSATCKRMATKTFEQTRKQLATKTFHDCPPSVAPATLSVPLWGVQSLLAPSCVRLLRESNRSCTWWCRRCSPHPLGRFPPHSSRSSPSDCDDVNSSVGSL